MQTKLVALLSVVGSLIGCATSPPSNPDNLCEIFREKDDWYEYAYDTRKKWGVPISVQMAILRQESRYQATARPPRKTLLGFIPTFSRLSSAYGYAQALDGTWARYIKETGNSGADRDDFEDVTDFVGWYTNRTTKMVGIRKSNAYGQYLAYHEGQVGYRRRTYRNKPWLIKVARNVSAYARRYKQQLLACQQELEDNRSFWPFW